MEYGKKKPAREYRTGQFVPRRAGLSGLLRRFRNGARYLNRPPKNEVGAGALLDGSSGIRDA
jgi:hypothetical protein